MIGCRGVQSGWRKRDTAGAGDTLDADDGTGGELERMIDIQSGLVHAEWVRPVAADHADVPMRNAPSSVKTCLGGTAGIGLLVAGHVDVSADEVEGNAAVSVESALFHVAARPDMTGAEPFDVDAVGAAHLRSGEINGEPVIEQVRGFTARGVRMVHHLRAGDVHILEGDALGAGGDHARLAVHDVHVFHPAVICLGGVDTVPAITGVVRDRIGRAACQINGEILDAGFMHGFPDIEDAAVMHRLDGNAQWLGEGDLVAGNRADFHRPLPARVAGPRR